MGIRWRVLCGILVACIFLSTREADCETGLRVGFAETDITPDVHGKAVWLAGYGMGRRATGVHDPLVARCVVLQSGSEKVALVAVDLVGLQFPTVLAIRRELPGFRYVMVSSTHNHEGPDVVGIWGPTPFQRGVDDEYVKLVVARVVQAARDAEAKALPASVSYGTAEDETLLRDSRKPYVKDGVLRVLRFTGDDGQTAGLLVQWNCHPESMGSKNTLVTADFPYATLAALKQKYACPVAYFSGAVGGLMAPPDGLIKNAAGKLLDEGDFEYTRIYGEAVARLASQAIEAAQPIALTPFVTSSKSIAIPVENPLYRAARALGVVNREARVWAGSSHEFGAPLTAENADQVMAIESEVAYLRLGELHVACIPGEIYPELVYGRFQEPAEPNADYPEAPLEPSIAQILPGKKWLLFGLANDELGYIIPRRQWDSAPPFAYGRNTSQYGEVNSCGAQVAPIIMQSLTDRVREAK